MNHTGVFGPASFSGAGPAPSSFMSLHTLCDITMLALTVPVRVEWVVLRTFKGPSTFRSPYRILLLAFSATPLSSGKSDGS